MTEPARIVPAVLTDDAAALTVMLRQAEGFTGYVQMDIMDGKFVPTHTVGLREIVAAGTSLTWEAHLMVENPVDYFVPFREAGAAKVIFHYEATQNHREVIDAARRAGLLVGLAVNPETPLEKVLPLAQELDSVLFMTVHPGYYGAEYLPEIMDKVRAFCEAMPDVVTAIDGGAKASNIQEIAASGLDYICVGSAVFKASDPGAAYRKLLELAGD
jgi:ribulose-phosphate 3-epimerase